MGTHCETTKKFKRYFVANRPVWPERPNLVRAKPWSFSPELCESPKTFFRELDYLKCSCPVVFQGSPKRQ